MEWLKSQDTRDRLAGLSMILGALDQGRTADISHITQRIDDRKRDTALQEKLASSGVLDQFTPQQREILTALPPAAATRILAQHVFREPEKVDPMDALRQRKLELEIQGLENPTVDPMDAIKLEKAQIELNNLKNPTPSQTDDIREYEFAVSQGFQGSFTDFMQQMRQAGSSSVTVNNEAQPAAIPEYPKAPAGYMYIRDPETGQVVINDQGVATMAPIVGGPEDTTQFDQEKESARDTSSQVVTDAFSRALIASQERIVGGLAGQAASINPSSQNAEVYRQVGVLQDVTSAESLNAMRRQSPTGGALGNVTERELALLARQGGALDPASPNFERDLMDYTRALLRTIHGKAGGDAILDQMVPRAPTTPDFGAMTDEELDRWIEENGQ